MIPKTLSASSLQVASMCLDRWRAEYMNRAPGFGNAAADVGIAVHGGLEGFVKAVYIDKTHAHLDRVQQKELLISYYQMSYVQTFQTADMETETYKDGFNLTMRWFERTDLSNVMAVVSVEVKKKIEIPFNHPEGPAHTCEHCSAKQTPGVCYIPFNYIMDRVDQIDETVWEVIDYKTIRVPIQPEDLQAKVQARAYALAAQIEHPEATKIKVTFDLLRHEKVSIWFTREDNANFWHYLCAETQRIVNTPEKDVKPTLNPECMYCVKKATCPLLTKNISNGGVHSVSIDEAVSLKAQLENQMKAQKYLIDELEEKIFKYAAQNDVLEWETEDGAHTVKLDMSRRRTFDAQLAAKIMGEDLFAQMGNMTLGNLEKVINDNSLDPEMRKELKALIGYKNGNLSLKIAPKKTVF